MFSTEESPKLFLSRVGSEIFYWNYIIQSIRLYYGDNVSDIYLGVFIDPGPNRPGPKTESGRERRPETRPGHDQIGLVKPGPDRTGLTMDRSDPNQ